MSPSPVPEHHKARRHARRRAVGEAATRRAYLDLCAALETPPRNRVVHPRQARRMVHRALIGAA